MNFEHFTPFKSLLRYSVYDTYPLDLENDPLRFYDAADKKQMLDSSSHAISNLHSDLNSNTPSNLH